MNKHLSKNIQNIDMNKTVKIGVSTTEVEKQTHFEKMSLKYIYCNWNLQTQIDQVLLNKHLNVHFSTSLKQGYYS